MSLYTRAPSWDQALIERYDLSGPRYTSYPTAPQFHDAFSEGDWREAVARSNAGGKPLSLYVHIPFCDTLCFYCACNKLVTHNHRRSMPYLEKVAREMRQQAELFDTRRPVEQLHWGGGTPSFLSRSEMSWLMKATREHFRLLDNDQGEYSVEVHPGRIDEHKLGHLRSLGFNRLSMGIQDFNPRVQEEVNRYNSFQEVKSLVEAGRDQGYQSISMDLIYGLPLQTPATVLDSVERVIELGPDRLSLFNYAHMPHIFKSQRLIHESDLPSPEAKLEILHQTIERLQRAGYVYIGMDHFAKPDDSLVNAQQEGRMQRNFQGYSTHAGCDLLAFGVSAISSYGGAYIQNEKNLKTYQDRLAKGEPAFVRGFCLSDEDKFRATVINQLICHFRLDFAQLERDFGVNPEVRLAEALAQLEPMESDGLLSVTASGIEVHNRGRLLIRRICMVFDQYLEGDGLIRYSKVI